MTFLKYMFGCVACVWFVLAMLEIGYAMCEAVYYELRGGKNEHK